MLKKIIYILVFGSLLSCHSNTTHKEKREVSAFDTSHYYIDKKLTIKELKEHQRVSERKFSIWGDDGFLDSKRYDIYIVYSYRPWHGYLKSYVIKVLDSIAIVSYKELISDNSNILSESSDSELIKATFVVNSISCLTSIDSVRPFKTTLERAIPFLHKKEKNIYINENVSSVVYFNGSDYYSIIPEFSSTSIMGAIDSVFLNSKIFIKLQSKIAR